ncbi:MAG: hypothetical protein K2K59_00645 [Muribaculaceae bacterium]|nr:hypothetical protein [Muribaculaceae bacterium]
MTAKAVSPLIDAPISVGYYEDWVFDNERSVILSSDKVGWVEMDRINSGREGRPFRFSVCGYCARRIFDELHGSLECVTFENKTNKSFFLIDATEEPFALYEVESLVKFFDLRIFKEIVDFSFAYPLRWSQFVNDLRRPHVMPNKAHIMDFRRQIFRQMQVCGCDRAYYFADQGPGEGLFDAINLPAQEWVDYMRGGSYIRNGRPIIMEVQRLLDGSLKLQEDGYADCFVDDFSDFFLMLTGAAHCVR